MDYDEQFRTEDLQGQLRMTVQGDYEVLTTDEEGTMRAVLLDTDTHDMWE